MSKKVIKPIVLIVVFIAALITFCITTNKGNKDMNHEAGGCNAAGYVI